MTSLHLHTLAAAALLGLAAAPALAHDEVFVATLTGAAEAPANNSPGVGTAIVTVNSDDFTMRVQVTFASLAGTVTAAHIHCCTGVAGVGTAGVASVTPTFTGFPSGVTAGSYDQTFNMALTTSYNSAFLTANGNSASSAFAALYTGIVSGNAYLNIHSTSFGGGEIRGFLLAAPVPEPASYALMLAGVLGVAGAVARRRQAA